MTKAQQLTGQDELNGAAMPTYGQSGPGQTFETKQIPPRRVVDFAPIAPGRSEGRIQKLSSLIKKSGSARQCHFQSQLRKGIERAQQGRARGKFPNDARKPAEIFGSSRRATNRAGRPRMPRSDRSSWFLLFFTRRLEGIVLHPAYKAFRPTLTRPGANERLIYHVFVRLCGRRLTSSMPRVGGIAAVPILEDGIPVFPRLPEGKESGAGILSAFCVVSGGRGQSVGPVSRRCRCRSWKPERPSIRPSGIAADFIERKQPPETIEGRVFHRLRHQRTGELLKLQCKIAHTRGAVAGIAGEVEGDCVCRKSKICGSGPSQRARAREISLRSASDRDPVRAVT